ncbi:hypothetical protein AN958_05223 [Leucoagaricus sp. SymC.cos]|nr:hypothetical protein AN958_05223 [Leucoagaricus sp. SymC.cos]
MIITDRKGKLVGRKVKQRTRTKISSSCSNCSFTVPLLFCHPAMTTTSPTYLTSYDFPTFFSPKRNVYRIRVNG